MLVKFFATYRAITKCASCDMPATENLQALLEAVSGRFGPAMRAGLLSLDGQALGDNAVVLVNGRNIAHLSGLSTPLSEGDVISIFPLVAGG